uniref:DNA replication factor Dna2 N-terminal domain-containing protein n=1 Tax=Nicotiana tabacum TaxID=4097 RepID=A0A1S3XBC6_TOBAC|nr:PREDICTED: uncharacterized protein LOC107763247 [Nicotiana tabacum]
MDKGVADGKNKEKRVTSKKNELGGPSQSTPTENVVTAGSGEDKNQAEITPEFCKSVSVKRFKFSPGMLIKQSQDDGGDEVTWRISPVNERLHAVSKQLPEMVKVLADSSRFNSLSIQECSLKKTSPGTERKFEKRLCSPPLKALDKSLVSSNRASLRNRNNDHVMDLWETNGNFNCQSKTEVTNSQSPFQTPPSLTYGSDKPANAVNNNEVTDQLGSRQHKKVFDYNYDEELTCFPGAIVLLHQEILFMSLVASSFSCSRRAVLDERLKSGEYSAAALIGT